MIEHVGKIPLQKFLEANKINLNIFKKDYIFNIYVENTTVVCDRNISLILNNIYYKLGDFDPLYYSKLVYDGFQYKPNQYIPVIYFDYFDTDIIPYLTYLYYDDKLLRNCSIISVIDLHPDIMKKFNKYFFNKLKECLC